MSAWKPKRFWKTVTVVACEGGFAVHLDARPVKTPGKTPLVVPTEGLAQAIAREWDAQQGLVRPDTMPCTRTANSALEKVAPQFDEVVDLLAAYGDSDLLCYRATGPQELIARQAAAWDPLLDWARTDLGAPLTVTSGVIHVPQAAASNRRLRDLTAAMSPFQIAAFHDLVSLSGSLILAFAVIGGRLSPAAAWTLGRIDETYQAELWGADEDAEALAESKRLDFHQAAAFWTLCTPV
jgi:chaperone required for assembly of F1-ATPase